MSKCDDCINISCPIKKDNNDVKQCTEYVSKPPLGVMPDYIWLEKRVIELLRAMYARAMYDFDLLLINKWNTELQLRLLELSKWKE